ncbi:MAG: GGDEF domain-containing protein, partial [Mycobacteriales bacterium]
DTDTEAEPVAVFFVDLDAFKPINDSHGHAIGDQALTAVARRLLGSIRDHGSVVRIGGDEFAVIQSGVTRPEAVRAIGERLVAELSRPLSLGGVSIRLGASVGAVVSRAGETIDDALERADQAMYEAKRRGGGQVYVASAVTLSQPVSR